MSDSVWLHRWQPSRFPCPWDSPGKNTGVGCHFLLQCMKVKSESEVAQSCLTPSNPVDCSLPGSSVHGIFQARVLEWVATAFSQLKRLEGAKFCRTWWAMGRHFFFKGETLKDLKQEDSMGFASWKSSFSYGVEYRLEQLRMEAGRRVRIDQVKLDGNFVQRLGSVNGKKEMDLQRDLRSQQH